MGNKITLSHRQYSFACWVLGRFRYRLRSRVGVLCPISKEWLIICGLLHRVRRVSKPGIPLAGYESQNAFKLYSLDCGLLGAMSRLDARSLVEGNAVFEEFKGSLTEQYVLQEILSSQDIPLAYWEADGGTAEVDFVAQLGSRVVPVEVKAGVNLRARSLASYRQRYAPECGIRTSLAPWEKQDWLYNIPLYAIGAAETLIGDTETANLSGNGTSVPKA